MAGQGKAGKSPGGRKKPKKRPKPKPPEPEDCAPDHGPKVWVPPRTPEEWMNSGRAAGQINPALVKEEMTRLNSRSEVAEVLSWWISAALHDIRHINASIKDYNDAETLEQRAIATARFVAARTKLLSLLKTPTEKYGFRINHFVPRLDGDNETVVNLIIRGEVRGSTLPLAISSSPPPYTSSRSIT